MLSATLTAIVALSTLATPPKLAVRAVRFYAPGAGQTSVLAFVQVPYALVEMSGGRIAWKTTIQMKDASGATVHEESWWRGVPAAYKQPDAYSVETLPFSTAKVGKFAIIVSVMDSSTGRSTSAQTSIETYGASPVVSDLLVASSMRLAADGDTATGPGEVSRGRVRFVTAPDLMLNGLTPAIAFMLEVYSAADAEAMTALEVRDPAGKQILAVPAFRQKINAGGGVVRGQLPLEGLPEGEYTLHATTTVAGQKLERSAPFAVGNLEAALAREVAVKAADRLSDEGYFGAMSEDELDRAAEVLTLIAKSNEISVYKATGEGRLSLAAKRRFLSDFWAGRDQNKDTEVNEQRVAFYDNLAYVNREFTESGRNGRIGWKTDRGRIFTRFGRPDEVTDRPSSDRAPPYVLWRYTQGRPRFFIFADRTRYGIYSLIKSNDLQEPGRGDWAEILTPEEILRFIEPTLGQRFCASSGGSVVCR